MVGHVWQECMLSGWHILQDDISYWNACFTGNILLEGVSYQMSCLTGIHVYRSACFTGWQTLEDYLSYRRTSK